MKTYLVGTILVVLGAILVFTLTALGFSHTISVTCGLGISVIGFGVQMWTTFSTKLKFEKEMKQAEVNHAAIMAAASKLPPEQAIALLLKNI